MDKDCTIEVVKRFSQCFFVLQFKVRMVYQAVNGLQMRQCRSVVPMCKSPKDSGTTRWTAQWVEGSTTEGEG